MSRAALIAFPDRRVAHPEAISLAKCDMQVVLRQLIREEVPVRVAVDATRDYLLMSDQRALDDCLKLAHRIARRMAGRAEVLAGKACACGSREPGHGAAA